MSNSKNDYLGVNYKKKKGYIKPSKKQVFDTYIRYMLARTNNMFEYENLPETLHRRELELYAQKDGYVCIAENEGKLYAYFGGFGGVPNEYYLPTEFIVANPYQKKFETLTIDENCVIMKNDSMYNGLMDLNEKYAHLLTENYVSINVLEVNSRMPALLTAATDQQKIGAEKYLEQVEDGKLSIIVDKMGLFADGINTKTYAGAGNTTMIELIEMNQYLKASWYNELGLQANYNMKREAINSTEGTLNEAAMMPLLDDMLFCRREAVEKINAMFGTNISVDFSSSWKMQREQLLTNNKNTNENKESEKESEGMAKNEN